MKKLLILVFALALAAPAFAQNKPTAKYAGIVEKYDAATKTLTIKKGDRQGEFVFADTSELTQGSAKAEPSAIAAGQKVEVEFWLDGAKKVVKKAKISAATTSK